MVVDEHLGLVVDGGREGERKGRGGEEKGREGEGGGRREGGEKR